MKLEFQFADWKKNKPSKKQTNKKKTPKLWDSIGIMNWTEKPQLEMFTTALKSTVVAGG